MHGECHQPGLDAAQLGHMPRDRALIAAEIAVQRALGMLQARCLTEHLRVPPSWQSRAAASQMQRLPQAKQLLRLFRLQVSHLLCHF